MPTTSTRSSLACPPRWGTPRREDRATLGGKLAEVAKQVGTPLMPWQRHVADVALEIDPDTGQLAYREVILTIPRQSGKTTLVLSSMVHRALGFGGPQRIIYTAQTRNDARRKWEDEHVAMLERSPLARLFEVRKSNGSEAIRWRNGSMHGVTSSTEKAGHGETLDLAVLDEAFAHEDERLEQSLKPTMITREQPQLWIPSTAGTDKSVYLRGKVDMGRARAELGLTDDIAYFEWSAPDEADPGDPATWRACMPALGHTVDERAVRANYESMSLREFRRAFLNQWPDAAPDAWQVIGKDAWDAVADPESQPLDPVAFAVDVTPERSAASIAVAGRRRDGHVHVEIVDHRPGTGWAVERLVELRDRWRPNAVVVDGGGPAGSLIAPLESAGVEVTKPTTRQSVQACGQLFDGVAEQTVRHVDQAMLNAALAGAQRRPLGDAWAWARKATSVDISPLVAVTLAAWAHGAVMPEPELPPAEVF